MDILNEQFLWWVSVIEVPIIAALFVRIEKLRDDLSHSKIHTAQYYASQHHVQELEERLTAHLLRIERKLDTTSLQTASLQARINQSQTKEDKL